MKKAKDIQIFTPSGCLTSEAFMMSVKGNIDKQQANEVRQHISTCSFCREAMEGVSCMQNPQNLSKQVNEIKTRLSKKNNLSWHFHPAVYYAAASVAVIFVISSIFYFSPTNNEMAYEAVPTEAPIPDMPLMAPIVEEHGVVAEENVSVVQHENSREGVHTESTRLPLRNMRAVVQNNPSGAGNPSEIKSSDNRSIQREEEEMQQAEVTRSDNFSDEVSVGADNNASGRRSESLRSSSSPAMSSTADKAKKAAVRNSQKADYANMIFRASSQYDELYNEMYLLVEEAPAFYGGETAMKKFIRRHINYPEAALEQKIEGKVFVKFMIDKEGLVKETTVVQGVNTLLDNEALRIIESMPRWKPGYISGMPVNVFYIIPVEFKIPSR